MTRGRRFCRCGVVVASVAMPFTAVVHADVRYSVVDLGVSEGKCINNLGVGGLTTAGQVSLWQNGIATPIPGLFADSGLLGINDASHLAGGSGQRAFIYRNGVKTDLGTLPGGGSTWATALNNNDVVVANTWISSRNGYHAFVWQNGITALPSDRPGGVYMQGDETWAYGINDAGYIAGSFNPYSATGGNAIIWHNGVVTELANLSGSDRGEAMAINGSNQVVGYEAFGVFAQLRAVIWDGTTPKALGSIPGYGQSQAMAINDGGTVIGNAMNSWEQFGHPFVWTAGVMEDLNGLIQAPGWELNSVTDLNNSGQIIGMGKLNGVVHAFLLNPVPAPGTGVMVMVMAGLGLGMRRRRAAVSC